MQNRPPVGFVSGDRMDEGIVIEGGQIWVLRLDVHHHGVVVHAQPHLARPVVVQVGEAHLWRLGGRAEAARDGLVA